MKKISVFLIICASAVGGHTLTMEHDVTHTASTATASATMHSNGIARYDIPGQLIPGNNVAHSFTCYYDAKNGISISRTITKIGDRDPRTFYFVMRFGNFIQWSNEYTRSEYLKLENKYYGRLF